MCDSGGLLSAFKEETERLAIATYDMAVSSYFMNSTTFTKRGGKEVLLKFLDEKEILKCAQRRLLMLAVKEMRKQSALEDRSYCAAR